MSGLLEIVSPCRRLAIVGTTKNAGKTTTLNWLLERLEGVVGITSVGRDGEAVDMVTERPKPRISPPTGTLVATSRATLSRATAKLGKVSETNFRTALGPVDIYRVESPGIVEVAGPVAAYQVAQVALELERCGAARIIIDGAIDRRASASIAQGVVLATGMALDPDEETVYRITLAHCRMLDIKKPPIDAPDGTGVWSHDHWTPWEGSILDRESLPIPEDAEYFLLDGALTEGIARRLLKKKSLGIVVNSGSHLLTGADLFEKMREEGFAFYARRAIELLAITLNPSGGEKRNEAAESFYKTMLSLPAPVFDLCLENERGIVHAPSH
ncbi:MAG TPA: hypothetical protein DD435_07505 [Cyanobacteria bacterium UBA8530]|nr:hypothetical protein [Cyanobacteria bacterium UBA8530]